MNKTNGFREIDLIGKPVYCGKTFGSGYPFEGYTCYYGKLEKLINEYGPRFIHNNTPCECVRTATNELKLELES